MYFGRWSNTTQQGIQPSSNTTQQGIPSCAHQDGKPPTLLDAALAWSRAAPGENLVATYSY